MMTKKQRPSILQILPSMGVGGVERGTLEIAKAIIDSGGEASIACGHGVWSHKIKEIGAHHFALSFEKSFSPIHFFYLVRKLRSLIRDHKIMLVHARSRYPAWVAWVACYLEKVPLVTTWHGTHHGGYLKKSYNASLLRGDRVIAVSDYIMTRLYKTYHIVGNHVRCIPRGVSSDIFNPEVEDITRRVQKLRDAWHIKAHKKIILIPGRLTDWKGQKSFIEFLGKRKNNLLLNCIYIFVGPFHDKSYLDHLRKLIEKNALTEQVILAGHCEDMPAAYSLSSVVALPSLRAEPFGRVAVEAQLMGRIVIAFSHGGHQEILEKEGQNYLVPTSDFKRFFDILENVLTMTHHVLKDEGERMRHTMLKNYTLEAMQYKTLKVYNELINYFIKGDDKNDRQKRN